MKKTFTLCIAILLFSFGNADVFAQVGKGQKMLEDKKYDGAQAAFAKDFNDANSGPAAYLGWAKAALGPKTTTYDSAMMAYTYLILADSLYKSADTKAKASMQKEGMSTGASDTQKKAALAKAWDGLTDAYLASPDDPAYFDQMDILAQAGFFKRGASKKKIIEVRSAIIGKAWAERDDYATLSAIMSRHDGMIPSAVSFQKGMTPSNRLWASFIKEIGMQSFEEFKKTHPSHWASKDCKSDAAIKAFKSENASEQFKFFVDNPESCVAPDALAWWFSKTADKSAVSQDNGAEKFAQYDALAQILARDNNQAANNAQVMTAVKALAPSQAAFVAVRRTVNTYLSQKQWDKARALVQEAKLLFIEDEMSACSCENYTRKSWFSQMDKILDSSDGNLGAPKLVGEVNTPSREICPVVAGPYLYFGGEGRPSGVGKADPYRVILGANGVKGEVEPTTTFAGAKDEYVMSATIDGSGAIVSLDNSPYYVTQGAKGWSKPAALDDVFSSIANIGHATLSPLGDYLIFDGAGTEGNTDLYVSVKNHATGGWLPANSMPKVINTKYSEKSPYLHADGKSLYFASDGLLGLGEQDLFMSKRLDDTWLNWADPVNLGKTINTGGDDSEMNFSVGPQGNIGYYATTAASGKSDIYSVELPEHARAESMIAVALKASLPNQMIKITTVDGEDIKTVQVGPEGQLSFAISADFESVILNSSTDTIFAVPMKLDLNASKLNPTLSDEFKMQSLGKLNQEGLTLPEGVFQVNGADLNMQGQSALEKYYKLISKRNAPVVITGHSDSPGSAKQATARAESIKTALTNFGYDAKLITVESKGADEPIGSNDTEAGRRKNRRVEVKILRK